MTGPEEFSGAESNPPSIATEVVPAYQLADAPTPDGQRTPDWILHPEPEPSVRMPHLGHLALLGLLALFGALAAGLLTRYAFHLRLFGVTNTHQAMEDIRYTLGSQGLLYFFTLIACLLVFPLVWHKSFFAGIQWRGATALSLYRVLFGAAFLCFVLAILNGVLMPGPKDAPIDKLFRTPGAAWLMFAFGVTCAPFFEEVAFRGFLLPSLATAVDWMVEENTGRPPRPLDRNGHPQWSFAAMAIASICTSLPFALMHAEQNGHALGPLLLLICVSLILCWVRLATRSLAASVLVHASYNFLLFSLMMLGTDGFRHLDKM